MVFERGEWRIDDIAYALLDGEESYAARRFAGEIGDRIPAREEFQVKDASLGDVGDRSIRRATGRTATGGDPFRVVLDFDLLSARFEFAGMAQRRAFGARTAGALRRAAPKSRTLTAGAAA